ncbi:hypothetical protein FOA52_014090 [Chlamydomonas sp. UWO 241]|nr:hypothetical protein FOA52_014090 [Chlamydomonas sp. UWO 241]
MATASSSYRGPGFDERAKQEALASMDLVRIGRSYLLGAVGACPGYKVLLLDRDTMQSASTLLGRVEMGEHGVVLVERIHEHGGKRHEELKAICFLRPTRENVRLLKEELRAPRFHSYHVYFSNIVPQIHMQELAEADALNQQVHELQEYYADFSVVGQEHFLVPCPYNDLLLNPKASVPGGVASLYEQVDRFVQGLSSLFLALKRRPVIRFQRGSDGARRLADSLYQLVYRQQGQLFDFKARGGGGMSSGGSGSGGVVVLLLDRKDDPVTPLLTQWTYQAMIHELLGMQDGRVTLRFTKEADLGPDGRELVLDAQTDDFFAKHRFSNYGEVGMDVKSLLDVYQSKSTRHKNVESLDDMKRFIAEHGDFTRLQNNVTKHVHIMGELAEVITRRHLMEISSAEQEMANPAANLSSAASYEEVLRLTRLPGVADKDCVRLAMLYALRFESDTQRVRSLMDALVACGVRDRAPGLFSAVQAVLAIAGGSERAGDLYASRSMITKALTMFRGLKGVENVYTQHTPLLAETLSLLSQDKLEVADYPYMAGSNDDAANLAAAARRRPPREVIVFIVGGSTYEEHKAVAEWNTRNPGCRVLLGGSALLNSDALLAALST